MCSKFTAGNGVCAVRYSTLLSGSRGENLPFFLTENIMSSSSSPIINSCIRTSTVTLKYTLQTRVTSAELCEHSLCSNRYSQSFATMKMWQRRLSIVQRRANVVDKSSQDPMQGAFSCEMLLRHLMSRHGAQPPTAKTLELTLHGLRQQQITDFFLPPTSCQPWLLHQ